MKLHEAANGVIGVVEGATGQLSESDRQKIAEAVIEAMKSAASACCMENDMVVANHLKHDPTLAKHITEESDMRRKALIANLSAAW